MSMFVPSTYYACDCVWVWALSNSNRIQTLYSVFFVDRQATTEVLLLTSQIVQKPCESTQHMELQVSRWFDLWLVWMVMWLRHDKCWRTIQGLFFRHTAKTSACNHHLWLHGICLLARLHIQAWTSLWNRQKCSCVCGQCLRYPEINSIVCQKLARHFAGVVFFYQGSWFLFTMCSFVRASCVVRAMGGLK